MADHYAQIAPIRDMRQRVGLVARKDETARLCMRQCGPSIHVIDLMALPFCHELRRAMQALFCFDHGAGCEAIFAASVFAELDQVRRAAHRAYNLVELV